MNHTDSSLLPSPLCLYLPQNKVTPAPRSLGLSCSGLLPCMAFTPQPPTLTACIAAQLCGSPASRRLHVASSAWHALP